MIKNCVYILLCANNRYYTGSTEDLSNRLKEHTKGKVDATKNLLPVHLKFYQVFKDIKTARSVEYQIKKKKSRKIIEQIIKDKYIKFVGR